MLLALAVATTTLTAFAAFGVYVLQGGAYEGRTVAAMSMRTVVWLAISWLACWWVWRPS